MADISEHTLKRNDNLLGLRKEPQLIDWWYFDVHAMQCSKWLYHQHETSGSSCSSFQGMSQITQLQAYLFSHYLETWNHNVATRTTSLVIWKKEKKKKKSDDTFWENWVMSKLDTLKRGIVRTKNLDRKHLMMAQPMSFDLESGTHF